MKPWHRNSAVGSVKGVVEATVRALLNRHYASAKNMAWIHMYVIAWDICKCFDKSPREFMWASMRKMGVDDGMISDAASTLADTECVLHVEGMQETVHMKQGTAQGLPLGPVLCLYFLLPTLNLWHVKIQARHTTTWRHTTDGPVQVKTSLKNFADDTVMIVGSEADARLFAKMFAECIETFPVKVHKASSFHPEKPSKSVVVHVPAIISTTRARR
jgi:hypothetical protein